MHLNCPECKLKGGPGGKCGLSSSGRKNRAERGFFCAWGSFQELPAWPPGPGPCLPPGPRSGEETWVSGLGLGPALEACPLGCCPPPVPSRLKPAAPCLWSVHLLRLTPGAAVASGARFPLRPEMLVWSRKRSWRPSPCLLSQGALGELGCPGRRTSGGWAL